MNKRSVLKGHSARFGSAQYCDDNINSKFCHCVRVLFRRMKTVNECVRFKDVSDRSSCNVNDDCPDNGMRAITLLDVVVL